MVTFGLDVPAAPPETWSGSPRSFYSAFTSIAATTGFSRLWVGDHAVWHRPRYEAIVLLSALAAMTDIGVGSGILLAPLRHPLWIAKAAASLDRYTSGDFILGMGVGGECEAEFRLLDVDVKERGELTDHAIEICRRAWAGDLDEHFSPLPTRGDIPIWIGGRKRSALRRAGLLGDGYLGLFLTPERFEAALGEVAAHRQRADRPGAPAAAIAIWCACDENDPEAARREVRRAISTEYRLADVRFERYIVAGAPDAVIEDLHRYVEAGAEHIVLHVAHPNVLEQVKLLAERVIGRI